MTDVSMNDLEYYVNFEPSARELEHRIALVTVGQHLRLGSLKLAQEVAYEWAEYVRRRLGLRSGSVWKHFKREVLERYFPAPERRRFAPGWSTADVLSYAWSIKDRRPRISVFAWSIACHSASHLLPEDDIDKWFEIIDLFNHRDALEVFPESSSATSVCFRRLSYALGDQIVFEVGRGQAMDVFEGVDGVSPSLIPEGSSSRYPLDDRTCLALPEGADDSFRTAVAALLEQFDSYLDHRSRGLCRCLGVDWVSIEGYFDSAREPALTIVDVDIPLDQAFMHFAAGPLSLVE